MKLLGIHAQEPDGPRMHGCELPNGRQSRKSRHGRGHGVIEGEDFAVLV